MQRSVERVEGVEKVEINLNTGRATVTMADGKTVAAADLWRAVEDSGFTPVRIEMGDSVYEGSDP